MKISDKELDAILRPPQSERCEHPEVDDLLKKHSEEETANISYADLLNQFLLTKMELDLYHYLCGKIGFSYHHATEIINQMVKK